MVAVFIKDALRAHLQSLVSFDGLGYSEPKENTLRCAASTLWFECAYSQSGSKQRKYTEALRGLPSYINIPFYDNDIEGLMYAIGYEGVEPVGLYWDLCGEILAEAF